MSPNTPQITPELSQAPTLLALASLAPRDEPPLNLYLAAVHTLVQWQLQPAGDAAPAADAAKLTAQLQGFSHGYLLGYRQCVLDEGMRKTVDGALATLVAQYMALPTTAVHGGLGPDQ